MNLMKTQILFGGCKKDQNFNGKFKISVVSTGIDNENYYKNILRNENNTDLQQIEIEPKTLETSNTFNSGELPSRKQESFFVDLQETSNKTKIRGNQNEENSTIKNHKKRSLFSKIFGLKEKTENKNNTIEEVIDEKTSEMEFKNEMKEVIEENLNNRTKIELDNLQKENNSNEGITISNSNQVDDNISELEVKKDKTDLDDDLLQIPAFKKTSQLAMSSDLKHLPVLVDEVISHLNPKSNKIYFDGTFGQGGYSKSILEIQIKSNCYR